MTSSTSYERLCRADRKRIENIIEFFPLTNSILLSLSLLFVAIDSIVKTNTLSEILVISFPKLRSSKSDLFFLEPSFTAFPPLSFPCSSYLYLFGT